MSLTTPTKHHRLPESAPGAQSSHAASTAAGHHRLDGARNAPPASGLRHESDGDSKQCGDSVPPADPASLTMSVSQLVLFTRQMSMLLTSGSGLVPALSAIAPQMRAEKHRRMLEAIRNDLEQGLTLTDALSRYPRTFDVSYCAVVAAGESSARLPQTFARLAVILGKRRAMKNKIIGTLIYPTLLIVLSMKIMAVMLFFVVPRFADMFNSLGVAVPASTQALLHVAGALRNYWYLAILLVAGSIAGLVYLVRSPDGRQLASNMQTRIPLVRTLARRLIQGQVFRILGMLIEARVGLLEALELAGRVTRNGQFRALFAAMSDSVTRGDSVSGAMDAGHLISPSIIQAVRTGEQSGRLGEAINFAADVLDEENAELLATATKLIEPLVLIGMGLIVGAVAISLFMPLFDMTSAV